MAEWCTLEHERKSARLEQKIQADCTHKVKILKFDHLFFLQGLFSKAHLGHSFWPLLVSLMYWYKSTQLTANDCTVTKVPPASECIEYNSIYDLRERTWDVTRCLWSSHTSPVYECVPGLIYSYYLCVPSYVSDTYVSTYCLWPSIGSICRDDINVSSYTHTTLYGASYYFLYCMCVLLLYDAP